MRTRVENGSTGIVFWRHVYGRDSKSGPKWSNLARSLALKNVGHVEHIEPNDQYKIYANCSMPVAESMRVGVQMLLDRHMSKLPWIQRAPTLQSDEL